MAKIEPANLLLTDKDGNTGLVKSLTNKDVTTLKGVVTNVDYIKDYMNTNNITLPVQGDIHLTATDEEGNNGKTLLGTSSGTLQWNNQNLVRSVNGLIADTYGNVNVKLFELQKDVQKSFTGTLSATLTNTDSTTTTKTVTKSYEYAYHGDYYSSPGNNGRFHDYDDTFTYGVTFNSTPHVTTSDSDYYQASRVTTTNANIELYADYHSENQGGRYYRTERRPAGSATATGQVISSKVVSKTVSKTVNYGVTYKDVPTISNVVGCTVTDIGTTACTVTTTLSTTLSSGQSTELSSDFSFDVIGDVIINSED